MGNFRKRKWRIMKEILKKLKLIGHQTTELEVSKNEFVSRFQQHVDQGSTSTLSSMFEAFSSGKNEYKGYVSSNGFRIRRKRKLFDMNMNFALATGEFRAKNNLLVITTEVNGFHGMMIPFYIFITIFYLIFILGFSFTAFPEEGNGPMALAIPFVLVHAAFMYGMPYFIMRRSVSRMKHELEREFFYMTKKEATA